MAHTLAGRRMLGAGMAGLMLLAGMAVPVQAESAGSIARKLETIIIPAIDFRGAAFPDVVDFLALASRQHDKSRTGGASGVSLILNVPPVSQGGQALPPITFRARNLKLGNALAAVCRVAGLKYRIEHGVIMITPRGSENVQIETRTYKVQPDAIERISTLNSQLTGGK